MPTRQEVAQFLSDFNAATRLGFTYWMIRPDDRQHLIDLNITQNQALEVIKSLTPDDYSKGPEPDDMDPNGQIWVFGADIDGVEAYIKLTLKPDDKRRSVIWGLIWSFHPAEFPLRYPLKIAPPGANP
jgi:hypothetical protein